MNLLNQIQQLPERDSLPHEPECCCQFNPSTENYQRLVLASNCCSVHNTNPMPCQAEICCKGRESDYDPELI